MYILRFAFIALFSLPDFLVLLYIMLQYFSLDLCIVIICTMVFVSMFYLLVIGSFLNHCFELHAVVFIALFFFIFCSDYFVYEWAMCFLEK